ncbi:SigE family RNA polymerase sigma factor [Hamadaea tsunoensis]|uniref:SigE family RNA polymerase sigma factor n=1 Tax=Hamadaea tsunoensis TaxID=53368 RepID=UPI000554E396|nr:SigE family RNA polymerase sigma factor [Hamadaea tsunoensis]
MPPDEFREFVEARYAALLRTAYLLTGSTHAAEDLVQTALLDLLPRFATVAEPFAYARRSMINQRTSLWRRLGRREVLGGFLPDRPGADHAAAADSRQDLLQALNTLPVRMRAVLVLRYWEDLSEADTAEILGCSTGTVKAQASRGLARLRTALGARPAIAVKEATA